MNLNLSQTALQAASDTRGRSCGDTADIRQTVMIPTPIFMRLGASLPAWHGG